MTERRSAQAAGWREVLIVAAVAVGVVLGAAVLTSLLPTDAQRVIFRTPLLIGVLIVGTGFVLWRIASRRPVDPASDRSADPASDRSADPRPEP